MTPAPKRRWFRFSLRTLFVVVTVLGVWLGMRANSVHRRDEFLMRGVVVSQRPTPPARYWPRTHVVRRIVFGDMRYKTLYIGHAATDEDFEDARAAFPEARVSRWRNPSRARIFTVPRSVPVL